MGYGEYDKVSTSQTKMLYHFRNNYDDSSGNNNGLTLIMGSPLLGTLYGRHGYGLRLNNCVLYSSAGSYTRPFTFSLWLKVNTINTEQTIFCIGDRSYDNRGLRFYISSTNKIVVQQFPDGNSNVPNETLTSNTTINQSTWYFVTVVNFTTTRKIYINGVLDIENTNTITINGASANFFFGADSVGGSFLTYSQNLDIDQFILETIEWPSSNVRKVYENMYYGWF